MTPTFSGATTSYSLVVGENVSSITVNANAVAATSTVSGTGTYELSYGTYTINIVCTSQSGSPRTYTINVARQGNGSSVDNSGSSISRGDVNQDGKISNADIVFLKRHILGLSTLSGDALTAADVNQDGKISNADIVKVKRHILGLEVISN